MADDLIGKRIGGYEIIEIAGRGGMAVVYRARQVSMKRVVAIKILPRQFLGDATYMQRFNREADIVSRLEHRNIVPVYDYGEYDGQPYLVMRYMDGGSVDDLIRREGPLPVGRLQAILMQIAPALDYAHTKGVLHRDLKPSNILMDDDGGYYLTDFGIARLMGEPGAAVNTVTTQGVIGTPSYMSPEQAQGKPLDGRSDVYSLGVSLFEMATAARPFEGETPYSIAVLQVTTMPPAPRSLKPDLPIGVERVILKAMSKAAGDRYPNAVTMAEALSQAERRAIDKSLLDTQPGFKRSDYGFPEPIAPTVNVPSGTNVPPGTPPPGAFAPPPTQGVSPYTPPPISNPALTPPPSSINARRVRRPAWLSSALIGVIVGCAMLTIVAALAAIIIAGLNNEADPTPTRQPNASPQSGAQDATDTPRPTATGGTRVPSRTPLSGGSADDGTPTAAPIGQRPRPTGIPGFGAIAFHAEREGAFDIYTLDLTTQTETRVTNDPADDTFPAASPDGARIAFQSNRDGDFDIYTMAIDGSDVRRLTNNAVTDRTPTWTPDGESIIYASDTRGDGAHDLYIVSAGGGTPRLIYSDGGRSGDPQVSADGRFVIFTNGSSNDASAWTVKRLDLTTDQTVRLLNVGTRAFAPSFTPNGMILYITDGLGYAAVGRYGGDSGDGYVIFDGPGYESSARTHAESRGIVFTTDVSGRDELYLMTLDGTDVRALTTEGGAAAVWIPS